MSDISVLKTPNNQSYNFKDVNAIGALSFSGHTLTVTKRNLTATEVDLENFDSINVTDLNSGNLINTGTARFLNDIYGNISGNAATATKATQDESGNNIKETYGAELSINDHTITLKNKNGTSIGSVTVPDNNTTYTFSGGTNKIIVTPLGGNAQDVTITPSIANNITGSGTNGNLVIFSGANTIADGPAFDGNDTTKYLRHDGTWTAPAQSHYESKNVVGATDAITNTTSILSNGNVYLNSVENGAVTSSHKISGTNATTVTTDTSGNIIINSLNTWTPMTGATSSADGTVGYVNSAPPKNGYNTKYLRADGTWVVPPDTKALGSMTGTLAIDHGGTGETTAQDASNVFLNALDTENTAPTDTNYYISQEVGNGSSSTTYVKKPMSALWSYTNTKISNVLGLTATDYGGNAATATQLENSVNISVGNKTNSFDGSTAISFPTNEIGMKRSDLVPIQTATYTGLIGGNTTTNDSVNNSFYFMKLRPDEFRSQWKVCYRIKCYVPNNTSYCATAVVELYGTGQANAPIYHIFNQIYSTSYRPAYYHNYYRLSSAGYNNGCYNAIGLGFRNSKEQATANLTRTIYVELLETHQCTVEFLPDAIKWGSWENNATTNYTGLSEFDFYTNGLCETNDANSNTYDRRYLGSTRIMAGENKIFPYSLVMQLPNGTWESLTTTGGAETNKVVNPHGFLPGDIYLFYYNATIAAGTITTNNYLYETHVASDMKYSFNCGTTLTANKSIYIVGTITNGLFHVASEMYSLALPTTADGKYYMYLGETINTYQITMAALHPIYYFDGHLRQYSNDDPYIFTGGENKITIQSRGSQTSKDITFTASDPTKLPLTGGTLTGDLYGTNAVFSGDVTVGGNVAGTSGCTIQYDATNDCVQWVFNS